MMPTIKIMYKWLINIGKTQLELNDGFINL
jgi:hypothetical protein